MSADEGTCEGHSAVYGGNVAVRIELPSTKTLHALCARCGVVRTTRHATVDALQQIDVLAILPCGHKVRVGNAELAPSVQAEVAALREVLTGVLVDLTDDTATLLHGLFVAPGELEAILHDTDDTNGA